MRKQNILFDLKQKSPWQELANRTSLSIIIRQYSNFAPGYYNLGINSINNKYSMLAESYLLQAIKKSPLWLRPKNCFNGILYE